MSVTPLTPGPNNRAPADASFVVGPVFTSNRPWFCLSLGSPGAGQAGSVNVLEVTVSLVVAFVGQPIPVSQPAWTRFVPKGSNSKGTTLIWSDVGGGGSGMD